MFTVARALKWWAREMPDAIALSVEDDPIGFGELYAWSGRVGRHLQELGVKSGDRLMMIGQNSMNYAVLILAAMRIGAIGAPVSFRATSFEIAEAIEAYGPGLLFADADRGAAVAEALGERDASRLHSLDGIRVFRDGEPVEPDVDLDPEAPVFIIGTSGSTGKPKGVIYTQRGIMIYASEFALMEPRCARGASYLSLGPFSSASGYLILMQFLAMGVTIYIENVFEPRRALALLTRHRITTFLGVPIFFEKIAALPEFDAADLSGLYFTQVAGARVNAALLAAWRKKDVILRQAYGCTESGGAWAARNDTALTAVEKVGHGGMFNSFAVAGEDGGFAPPGASGEILFRGACLMGGYWNDPEGTAEAMRGGWFHTGDLGVMDEAGNLTFVDRLKDIIISGGLNISAAEVERAIVDMEGVEEVAVIAAEDPVFGETPMAVIFGQGTALTPAAVVERCDRLLANYKVPRYVAIQAEPLPRLPSGKISKPAIRAAYRDATRRLLKVR